MKLSTTFEVIKVVLMELGYFQKETTRCGVHVDMLYLYCIVLYVRRKIRQ